MSGKGVPMYKGVGAVVGGVGFAWLNFISFSEIAPPRLFGLIHFHSIFKNEMRGGGSCESLEHPMYPPLICATIDRNRNQPICRPTCRNAL